MLTIIQDIINNYYSPKAPPSNQILIYLPVFSFCFLILSFVIDRAIANHSKKKQIIREWYSKALLDPCLINCNKFFIDVKELTVKHLLIFDNKSNTVSKIEFLKYKGSISDGFEKLKLTFYNESLLPIYQNYPKIAENANNVLLRIQDEYVIVFGGKSIDAQIFDNFINTLYVEKGKLLAILEAPLSSKGKSKLDLK